jgi:hypothetical protein
MMKQNIANINECEQVLMRRWRRAQTKRQNSQQRRDPGAKANCDCESAAN